MNKSFLQVLKETTVGWGYLLAVSFMLKKSDFILGSVYRAVGLFVILLIRSIVVGKLEKEEAENKITKKGIVIGALLDSSWILLFILIQKVFEEGTPMLLSNLPFAIGTIVVIFVTSLAPRLEKYIEQKRLNEA